MTAPKAGGHTNPLTLNVPTGERLRAIAALTDERDALRAQRDELVAALRGLLDACTVFSKAQNAHDTCRPRPDSPGVLNARAALAKVQP